MVRQEDESRTGNGRATLATVAASAGVSVATVSKVLNGRSDVAPATRALVQELLHEHDYVGRRVDPGRFPTVELLFHSELNAYSLEVFEGILTTAVELRAAVAVSLRPRGEARAAAARSVAWVRDLAAVGRQAVITVTSELPPSDLAALARARIPIVVIDPFYLPQAQVTSVGSTNFLGGLAATQHLLELGHRRIAYLGGPVAAACNQARMQGYRGAMETAGVPVPGGYVRHGRFHHRDGVTEGASLLDLPEPPTAIFAGSDETAVGVIEAARARGLRVPEDLSIVGFDDTTVAKFSAPPLTTVRQPLREIGAVALRRALQLAAGEKVDSYHVELATELVVRESTAPPATR
ncbi:MAG TPA: LacI family DNA-binding transcriptional regulator [Mycobacteriales bacterium]|jgi:LacI family transcriptional regulator|nr:LacI family DNA-binding transcriptional regulator [Mycobacteriales bacterium]